MKKRFGIRVHAIAWLLLLGSAEANETCGNLATAIAKVSGGKSLTVSGSSRAYASLFDECDRHDTYGGRPLPMHGKSRLRCSSDANKVTSLARLGDGTVVFTAKAAVDADGSKYACGAGWPNQCGTLLSWGSGKNEVSVDSEETPFVAIPGADAHSGSNLARDTGIKPGDLAAAFYEGRCTFGVVGDSGPYFRLGELSLKAHDDLGHPRCKSPGQYPCRAILELSIPSGVNYVVFPGSRPKGLDHANVTSVSAKAARQRVEAFVSAYAN